MKRPLLRPRFAKPSGFTLVELLVVMGIIAILGGVALGPIMNAIKTAKRAQAATMASQIQASVLNYYTEYTVYPQDTGAFTAGKDYTISDTDDADWKNLLIALCGNLNPYTGATVAAPVITTNTRAIPFLTLKTSDIYSSAKIAPKNPLATGTQIYFNIAIDGDYDGILGVSPSNVTTLPNFSATTFNAAAQAGGGSSTAGVAVWANCNGSTSINNPAFWVKTY